MGIMRPEVRRRSGKSNELIAGIELKLEMPSGVKRVNDIPSTIEDLRDLVAVEMRDSIE